MFSSRNIDHRADLKDICSDRRDNIANKDVSQGLPMFNRAGNNKMVRVLTWFICILEFHFFENRI